MSKIQIGSIVRLKQNTSSQSVNITLEEEDVRTYQRFVRAFRNDHPQARFHHYLVDKYLAGEGNVISITRP